MSDICLTFIQLRNYRKCRPRVKRCWEESRDHRKRNEMNQSSTFVSRATRCIERVTRVFLFFFFFLFSISQFEGTAGQSIGNGRQRAVDTFCLKLLLPPWIQSTCNNLYNYLSTRCRKFLWIYYICYTIFRNFDSTIKWNTSIPIILAIRPRKSCLVAVLRKFHNVSYNPYIVNS